MKKQSVIGMDLGGTKIDLVRYDRETLTSQKTLHLPTHAEKEWSHVYCDLAEAIDQLRADDTVAVGVAVPGFVRQPEGMILTLPNIPGSQNIPLKDDLSGTVGLPVVIENDANSFAFAEAKNSAFASKGVVVGITMGTGVGGGIIIDGEIYRGAHGFAGEIGHMLLRPGEPPYQTKDKRGEVEQFLSGTAFGKRCEAADRPEEYLEGTVCSFMQQDVLREVAWMCVNLSMLIDPSLILFGGSAGRALKPHLDAIVAEMGVWSIPHAPLPEIGIGAIEDAATRGAAMLAIGSAG